jgi:hypothetical protein
MADNNNKYKNLLLVKEDEQQVYLCPSSPEQKLDAIKPDATSVAVSNVKSSVSSANEQNEKRILAEFKKVKLPFPGKSDEEMKASVASSLT